MKTKIVHLGAVRSLLPQWEAVRQQILGGTITGFQIALQGQDSTETLYVGGVYRADAAKALKTTLKLSAARMLQEEEAALQPSVRQQQ